MTAVITVIGKATVGITAKVSAVCAEHGANIIDITQKVLEDLFVMIMIVQVEKLDVKFTEFVDKMTKAGKDAGLEIHVMHEDIFNAMHTI